MDYEQLRHSFITLYSGMLEVPEELVKSTANARKNLDSIAKEFLNIVSIPVIVYKSHGSVPPYLVKFCGQKNN